MSVYFTRTALTACLPAKARPKVKGNSVFGVACTRIRLLLHHWTARSDGCYSIAVTRVNSSTFVVCVPAAGRMGLPTPRHADHLLACTKTLRVTSLPGWSQGKLFSEMREVLYIHGEDSMCFTNSAILHGLRSCTFLR